jgi:vacuolar-type H+-ATPase subunit E/Vma4
MASLIEDVLSIESRANEIIAKAHSDAKALDKSAQAQIEQAARDIEARTAQRVEAYRCDAEQKHQAALAAEKEESARRLSLLDRLDARLIEKLSGLVVAEFRKR